MSGIPTTTDLLHLHEIALNEARAMARVAAEAGDEGTNVIVSNVMRRSELQVWFVAGHVADTPLVQARGPERCHERPG